MKRGWKYVGQGAIVALVAMGCALAAKRRVSEGQKGADVPAHAAVPVSSGGESATSRPEILEPSKGVMEQVTKAILEGRPAPMAFAPEFASTTGDDADACRLAKRGDFNGAIGRAASAAMQRLLQQGKVPTDCPNFTPPSPKVH